MTNSADKRSLSQRYHRRLEVPLFIFLSGTMLVIGLSLPLMKVQKLIFWKNEYSVFTGVVGLVRDGQWLLAAVVFFFSMVFPFVKLVALLVLWGVRLKEAQRKSLLRWLGILGKWSMLDVFAVSILIVLVKLGPLAKVEPQPGLYFFCVAILCSMSTAMYVEHLARSART
jgi:paraquat-inducible protein A